MKNTKSILPIEVIDYLESYYETYNTLPTKVLECNAGTGAYTAFGQNLAAKVAKAGGIRNLIATFVGRGAKKNTVTASIEKRTKKIKVTVPEIGIEAEATAETVA